MTIAFSFFYSLKSFTFNSVFTHFPFKNNHTSTEPPEIIVPLYQDPSPLSKDNLILPRAQSGISTWMISVARLRHSFVSRMFFNPHTLGGFPNSFLKLISSFLALTLRYYFTLICHGEGLFPLNLKGVLCASWMWMAASFPRRGKFSAIIYSSRSSAPFFLSSSSGTLMIQILLCFIESLSSLILLSCSSIFLSL